MASIAFEQWPYWRDPVRGAGREFAFWSWRVPKLRKAQSARREVSVVQGPLRSALEALRLFQAEPFYYNGKHRPASRVVPGNL